MTRLAAFTLFVMFNTAAFLDAQTNARLAVAGLETQNGSATDSVHRDPFMTGHVELSEQKTIGAKFVTLHAPFADRVLGRGISQTRFGLVPAIAAGERAPSDKSTPAMKLKIQVNARAGYPYYFPIETADNFHSAHSLGFEIVFGRKIYAGLSIDYTRFREPDQIRTEESENNFSTRFIPEVSGQFYAFAVYYKPQAQPGRHIMTPYGGVKLGMVKRTFDIGLKSYAKVDDGQRFGLSLLIGLEFPITSFFTINSTTDYFLTSAVTENDWEPAFNAVRSYIAAHIGFSYKFSSEKL
ncbi:MAG: hypothetical protein ACOY90_08690 [Candidatus Zhuqueibacterota bacterium]